MGGLSMDPIMNSVTNYRNVGRTSPNEVTANDSAFTKTFLAANRNAQLDMLKKMSPDAKQQLFESLKSHYRDAGDPASKKNSEQALILTGANIINSMPGGNFRDLTINVMQFMNNELVYTETANEEAKKNGTRPPTGRDACEYSVGDVLLEGNYNGCVEAAKAYQALFNEAALQKGSSAKGEYVSSLAIKYADPTYIFEHKDQPGHALVEIRLGREIFLMNTSRLDDSSFKQTDRPTFKSLEDRGIILHSDNNDNYSMPISDRETLDFHIFNRGRIFNSETDATSATKSAAMEYSKWTINY